MEYFEYKVIPAPRRSVRVKGAKGVDGKFAATFEKVINELAAEGWQYQRAESLPVDERHGITMRKTETYQNILIFRRVADVTEPEEPVTALIEDKSDDEDTFDVGDENLSVNDSEDEAEYAIDEDDATEAEGTTGKQSKAKKVRKARKT